MRAVEKAVGAMAEGAQGVARGRVRMETAEAEETGPEKQGREVGTEAAARRKELMDWAGRELGDLEADTSLALLAALDTREVKGIQDAMARYADAVQGVQLQSVAFELVARVREIESRSQHRAGTGRGVAARAAEAAEIDNLICEMRELASSSIGVVDTSPGRGRAFLQGRNAAACGSASADSGSEAAAAAAAAAAVGGRNGEIAPRSRSAAPAGLDAAEGDDNEMPPWLRRAEEHLSNPNAAELKPEMSPEGADLAPLTAANIRLSESAARHVHLYHPRAKAPSVSSHRGDGADLAISESGRSGRSAGGVSKVESAGAASLRSSRWSQFTAQSALGRSLELQLWGGSAECRTGFGFGRGRSTGVLRGGGDELSSALAEVCEDEAEEFQLAKENLENVEMD